ncbi:protein of unassigned function [Methylobacterium oryzae CBMB20]|uniref:Protein of unassigned function n=1 Tax=Methylobacterium oryzae CBMB20 TaxID=693986 RepID=A0A089QF81_9HYPH|nr:protein of unassigned function [Methylobacterium oryzae CBMB20]
MSIPRAAMSVFPGGIGLHHARRLVRRLVRRLARRPAGERDGLRAEAWLRVEARRRVGIAPREAARRSRSVTRISAALFSGEGGSQAFPAAVHHAAPCATWPEPQIPTHDCENADRPPVPGQKTS